MSDRPTSHVVRAAATLAAGLVLAVALAPATVAAAAKSATKPATALPAATKTAASSSPATATIPLAKGEIAVQLWPSTTSSLLLVSLTLPDAVQLPARVRMPLPQDATVTWSGEIVGSDAAADVQRQFTIVDTGGGRAVEFVAQQSRDLQYEADLTAPSVTGNRVMTTLKWVQTTDALGVDPAVKLPAGATDVLIKPTPSEQPRTNTAGEALYTLPQQHPALGGDFTIEVTFQQGAATTAPGAVQSSGTSPLIWVFLVVLVVVVAVVVVLALRAGLSSRRSDED